MLMEDALDQQALMMQDDADKSNAVSLRRGRKVKSSKIDSFVDDNFRRVGRLHRGGDFKGVDKARAERWVKSVYKLTVSHRNDFDQGKFDEAWVRADHNDDNILDAYETKYMIKYLMAGLGSLDDDNGSFRNHHN